MSSQKAKELKALALSLSLVNDDLKNKRYLRKSEFYKESDRYKKEREARKLAALNLAKELSSKTPTISAALINAVNNAPAEVVGHAGDEEIKEGDFKKITGDTIGEIARRQDIRQEAISMTQKNIEEAIRNLKKTPEERAAAKRERGLSDELFSEILDRRIAAVNKNFNNAVDISPEQLQRASMSQLIRLKSRYQEMEGDDVPTSANAAKIIDEHLDIIEERLGLIKKQERAEAELKSRAIAKPTKPRLTRKPTPPAGPRPVPTKRGRGRPKSKEVAERKQMAKEDKPPKPRGRPRKKVAIVSQSEADKKLEEMLRQRQKTLTTEQAEELLKPPPKAVPIIERAAEAAAPIVGEGLKDYMNYMKGKKPTKDMKKLILLIGSQRAGNNSFKLKVEIEKLIHKIKHDLEDKIQKQKSKSSKEQLKAIELEKRKLLIREAAKKQLRDEARFKLK
jgi:hypothetical protein